MKNAFYYFASIVLLMMIVGCNAKENNGYTITGTMAHKDIDSVYIYSVFEQKLDSVAVIDGKFKLTGTTKEPRKVILGNFGKSFTMNLILDNDAYVINFNKDRGNFKGGKAHTTIYGFYETDAYNQIYARYEKAMELAVNNSDLAKANELRAKAEAIEEELFEYECAQYRKVIEGNYPTKTKLFALTSTYDWKNYPPEKQLEMLDEYEKEIGKDELIENHRVYLNAPAVVPNPDNRVAPNIGDTYRDVVATDKDGNKHKLSDVLAKNKYVILEFWASWCMPCRAEIPNLNKAYKKYKPKGLEIFSVSLDKGKTEWLQALKEDETTWINTIGENEMNSICAVDYGVSAIPSSFLISKEGKIIAKDAQLRGGMLDTKLAEFLK